MHNSELYAHYLKHKFVYLQQDMVVSLCVFNIELFVETNKIHIKITPRLSVGI